MSAWITARWCGAAVLLLALIADVRAGDPVAAAAPQNATEIRQRAEAAERAGDWDSAFALYCHLAIADRTTTPGLREKLANAYRRVQQLRRHRDPAFQSFSAALPTSDALALYSELMARVPVVYADPARSAPQVLWSHGVEEFDRALGNPAFVAAFIDHPVSERIDALRRSLRTDWAQRPVGSAKEARTTLRLLLNAVQDHCPIRFSSAVVLEFLCGACTGLDEYTVYLNPAMVSPDLATADLSDYGIYLAPRNGELIVDGIAVGSWAAHHTILSKGDRIARINGRAIEMGCLADAADALRFPLGGFHELETTPTAPDMLPQLVRLPAAAPTVYAAQLLDAKHGIGYLRVGSIQNGTVRELDAAIAELRANGMRVLVLDLRGNHGGNFLAGIEVAKRFLPSGIIVTTQGQVGEVANRVFSSDSGANAIALPVVVMIDSETASAAEVVAAALKDNNRATLVGMPTFGKGAVQYPLKLGALDDPNDPMRIGSRSGSVRLTIARLVSPNGSALNGIGVTPHLLESDPRRQEATAFQRALTLVPMAVRPSE